MAEFYPIIAGLIFVLALAALTALLCRVFLPALWGRYRIGRWILIAALAGLTFIIVWGLGATGRHAILARVGAGAAALVLIAFIALIVSVPISGLVNLTAWVHRRLAPTNKGESNKEPDPVRRKLLESALLAAPLAAVTAGTGGFLKSFSPAQIRKIKIEFDRLPQSLSGFKILQISDVHLGYYVTLADFERFLDEALPLEADLVLVTGDLADDLGALSPALRLIEKLAPPNGIYFCLGNHEYYRGVDIFRREIEKTSIKLLVGEGRTIVVGDTTVYLGGADDPRWLRRDNAAFLRNTVNRAMEKAPADSFRILMTHRPEGFDFASSNRVDLTLAGHTHGGQIGFGGQSIFESMGYRYLWGLYDNGRGGKLYTTSGLGHWFPFRLGCPAEAPLIELGRRQYIPKNALGSGVESFE